MISTVVALTLLSVKPSFELGSWGAHTPAQLSLGLSVHLGVELDDLSAYVLAQGGLLFVTGMASAVIEYRFVRGELASLAFAAGAGALAWQPLELNLCLGSYSCGGGGAPPTHYAVGAPFRLVVRVKNFYVAADAFVGSQLDARPQEGPGLVGSIGMSLGFRLDPGVHQVLQTLAAPATLGHARSAGARAGPDE